MGSDDTWAPAWDLRVGGVSLGERYRRLITRIRVEATLDGADELTIEASAWDEDANQPAILGETILGVGNQVVLYLGYGDNLHALQRFRLVREEARYTAGALPTVTIRGYSAAKVLVDQQKARSYTAPVADSDIATDLADGYGWAVPAQAIEATTTRQASRVKKQGTSDWEWLRQLAVANSFGPPLIRYEESLDNEVLYFRTTSLANQTEIATFVHHPVLAGADTDYGTLLEFAPTLSLAQVPTHVEVVGWDPVKQVPVKVVMEITETGQESTVLTGQDVGKLSKPPKSGSELQVKVLSEAGSESEKREVLYAGHVQTTDDAVSWASRWLRTRNQAFMVARAKTIGYELLWTGQIHRFEGLAPHHAGLWEVLQVTHEISSEGYTCDLDLARVLEEAATPTEGA